MTGPWDPERWHAATAALDALLDLSPGDRPARMEALRERDAALAADVSELLRDHEAARAGEFLEEEDPNALLTATATAAGSFVVTRTPVPPPLAPGTRFGAYCVVRILGRGGMGIVYEAEETDSGRRVALKVLQQRLGDARERARFEREGRLAASIDHEHCVYVFGATEVGGTPAIAMELMQGTLADRVAAAGPLAPGEAVDVILQLVEGLRAAEDAGILHRDIKPSNCFVDADGVVKIGDFGISRSLRPTEETVLSTRGHLTGTPMYAPPEQLRGATLDVRADIYSLGATLYELVTGRRPFVADDLMALLLAVASDPPEPPHQIQPAVPRGLSEVILRCLAKRREDRYVSHGALAAALEPYQSAAPTPATLGKRFVAGLVDHYAVAAVSMPITIPMMLPTLVHGMDAAALIRQTALGAMVVFLYYGLSEGRWRRTPGKALVGLTLVDTAGRPAASAGCWGRAALYASAVTLQGLAAYAVWWPQPHDFLMPNPWVSLVSVTAQIVTTAVLFSTARRHNGYAALHDLATGTRVVERRAAALPPPRTVGTTPTRETVPPVEIRGTFAVLPGHVEHRPDWRAGVDDRLRRPVWLRDVPPGTPSVTPARAALARPTRLRWLAGRRADREAWDVFEGVNGVPLTVACARHPSWGDARRWVSDIAHELASQGPGEAVPLALDRVWILDTGRAKLLDDPAADAPRFGGEREALAFLADMVRTTRAASHLPWPIGAQRFADALAAGVPGSVTETARAIDALCRRRACVTTAVRRLSIAAVVAFPLFTTAMGVGGVTVIEIIQQGTPLETRVAARALKLLDGAEHGGRRLSPADREAIEATLATHYRAPLADRRTFEPASFLMLGPEHKRLADRILRRPAGSPSDGPLPTPMQRLAEDESAPAQSQSLAFVATVTFQFMLASIGLVALVLAPTVRGLLFRLFGLEIVTANGHPASRMRVLARTAIAWAPVLLPVVVLINLGSWGSEATGIGLITAGLTVAAAGAVVAMLRPSRGVQDRLAGTWLVPR